MKFKNGGKYILIYIHELRYPIIYKSHKKKKNRPKLIYTE